MRSNKVNVFKKMLGMIMVAPVALSLSLFAVEPIHHWELDETDTNGSTYEDTGIIGDANGTCAFPNGCPTPTPSDGQVFGAQSFDGVDDVIEVNGTAFDWTADANATIEFWMKSSPLPQLSINDVMIGRSDGNGDLQWFVGIDSADEGKIRANIIDGGASVNGNALIKNDKWNHIAFVLNPGMVKIYVNGEYDFNITRTQPATDLSCDTNVTIGTLDYLSTNWSYTGQLDDIKLYSTDLNGSTINEHYENGFAPHLKEVYPVDPTPTTNPEPAYTFSSDEAGDISYQGCTSEVNMTAIVGNNPIIFGPLDIGIYDDCNITVTDADGNASYPLEVKAFEVTAEPAVTTGGGGGCTYNPNSKNFDMTFLLMMALGLLYPFRRRFIK